MISASDADALMHTHGFRKMPTFAERFAWKITEEKRIRRVSYGNARPRRDFPLLARAYLDGSLMLDEMISSRIGLEGINDGFGALKRGEVIRSVVMFD